MSDDELHERDCATPVSALADELLRLGASLTLIIDHMARAARAGSDPVDVVLKGVLCELLERELAGEPVAAVRTATRMLRRACDAIGRDLFLVDVPPEPG